MTLGHKFVERLLAEAGLGPKWKVGDTVKHPSGRTVKIVSGQYLSNGRVSNHWTWREVLPSGKLGKIESGYGW